MANTNPPSAANASIPGIHTDDWIAANRIQVRDGSLFLSPTLVIHPRELRPENEAALRQKLDLTYRIDSPSFYEDDARVPVALSLAQLLPVSPDARRSQLMGAITKFNQDVANGTDSQLGQQLVDRRQPFAAIVRGMVQDPGKDPVGRETLTNGLAVYLLIREKLTREGFKDKLINYVTRKATPEQVLHDLAPKVGVTAVQLREAGLRGGVEAIGAALGLDAGTIAQTRAIAQDAAAHGFSLNRIENWNIGRQLAGAAAPVDTQLATGRAARIEKTIDEARVKTRGATDVPAAIQREEQRIADALALTEPVQRALMFKLGYEICYSPEVTADDVAFYKGIYGLHRKCASNPNDVEGTYRVYFSGHGDLKGSMRTLVHEIAHNLWPQQFSASDVAQIDALAASDHLHIATLKQVVDQDFPQFEALFNAYRNGDAAQKTAVIQAANQRYAAFGLQADALFPYLKDAHEFQFAVAHASDVLSVEGARYDMSGYHAPDVRFREVISRFAELKQVEYRGNPQLLQAIAPGLNQVWEQHYLPHLERMYQAVATPQPPAQAEAANPARGGVAVRAALPERVIDGGTAELGITGMQDFPSSRIDLPSLMLGDRLMTMQQAHCV